MLMKTIGFILFLQSYIGLAYAADTPLNILNEQNLQSRNVQATESRQTKPPLGARQKKTPAAGCKGDSSKSCIYE